MVQTVDEVFSAGDVLGGRYRLERLLDPGHAAVGTGLWRAEDTTLARPVGIRLLLQPDARARSAFLEAAARASSIRDTRLAATYDADVVGTGRLRAAYLVREWVLGEPLTPLLSDGGLDPQRLGEVLRGVADAVAALHAEGGWHGRLHPDNVLLVDEGRVRLTDAGIATALAAAGIPDLDASGRRVSPPSLPPPIVADLGLGPLPTGPDDGTADPDVLLRRLQRYDTCDLARVCYAAATGTWPGGAWRTMRAAPDDGARPLTARRVRAAVPRDVDAVITRTLLPPQGQRAALQTSTGVAAELARLQAPRPDEPAAAPREERRRSRWLLPVLALVSLVVLGIVGYSIGRSIGKVPGTATPAVPTFSPTTSGPAGSTGTTIALTTVTAFDPSPGDGAENDDQTPLAYDGSTATAWTTSLYDAPRLGNLKPGVGLLVDLGSQKEVSEVDLVLQGMPTGVELRAADVAGTVLSAYAPVAQQLNAGQAVRLTAGQSHRYWLVWLTSLPKVDGGYRGAIAEMTFRS